MFKSLPQEVPAETEMDRDDLAVVVLHPLRPHAPPADHELATGDGPEVGEVAHSEVGEAVIIATDEEAHGTVLTAEGVVLDDVIKATIELGNVDGLVVYRVAYSPVDLADLV